MLLEGFLILAQSISHFLAGELHVGQEGLRHEEKRLRRPLAEVVKSTAVDQGWELTAAHSEVVTDWRHAQANVEVLADALNELLLDQLCAAFDLDLIGQLLVDVVLVLTEHQIRHLTRVKNIIDVLKERLHQDL